ncbi:MAG: putative sugar aldolase [Proteobacteria bacterium]|nr:putative sugar aldolase [Pseudomonadota bacterium]
MTEQQLREQMASLARSLFMRGYVSGGAGNISVRLPDGNILISPTGSSFGELNPDALSKLSPEGELLAGDPPSKEWPMHMAMYANRVKCGAVVHLHSTWLTALSCLSGLPEDNCLPPITPYYVMRVGKLPLLPYMRPGSPELAPAVAAKAPTHVAVLLANHGPVVSGKDLAQAVANAEELEDTARLFLLLRSQPYNMLSPANVTELEQMQLARS